MAFDKLIWIGLFCCIGALLVNLFPKLTFDLGMNPGGTWMLFSFGLFLIVTSVAVAIKGRGPDQQ